MDFKLFVDAIVKITLGIVLFGLLIFLPAGTFNYWNGWLLIILLFIPMFIAGIVMMIKSPDLLRRRLDIKEMIKEIHKPSDCPEVYTRLVNDKNFPTLVQFDWR